MKPIIHFQALNEQALPGDWTGYVETGDSTLERSEDASIPYRGKYGLHLTCVNNYEYAYVSKSGLNISIQPGESTFVCLAQRFTAAPSSQALVVSAYNNNGDSVLRLYVLSSGKARISLRDDANNFHSADGTNILTGKWYWLGIELRRATSSAASDGVGRLYIDGVLDAEETGIDNYDISTVVNKIQVGGIGYTPPSFLADFDEVVVADKMVRPPLPAGKVWK